MVASGGAASTSRNDTHDLTGDRVDGRATRVAPARRPVHLELAGTKDGTGVRVGNGTDREDCAPIPADAVPESHRRPSAEADRPHMVAEGDGADKPEGQDRNTYKWAIEDDEGDVGVAEHLAGRVNRLEPVCPWDVAIDPDMFAYIYGNGRRVGVAAKVCAVVRATMGVTRWRGRDRVRHAVACSDDEIGGDERAAAER